MTPLDDYVLLSVKDCLDNYPDDMSSTNTDGSYRPPRLTYEQGLCKVQRRHEARCIAKYSSDIGFEVNPFVYNLEFNDNFYDMDYQIALTILPMLLKKDTMAMWERMNRTANNYGNTVSMLRNMYRPSIPPHQIYREIFKREQGREPSLLFIARIRSLINRLPAAALSLNTQLDIVHSLLHWRIREKIRRENFNTFQELSAIVEEIEKESEENTTSSLYMTPELDLRPCLKCRRQNTTRERCSGCDNTEHFHCLNSIRKIGGGLNYGGNDKCQNCLDNENLCTSLYAETSVSTVVQEGKCPMIDLKVAGYNVTGAVDTSVKFCIAGSYLYKMLDEKHYPFNASKTRVKLADGLISDVAILTVDLDVELHGRKIRIPFVIFLNSDYFSELLLGIDFLKAANLLLDLSADCYYFKDDLDSKYEFKHSLIMSRSAYATNNILRYNEGVYLKEDERRKLGQLLVENSDVFSIFSGECPYSEHTIDTGDHPPVNILPRLWSRPLAQELAKATEELLKSDIIEECQSDWCSPMLFVPGIYGTLHILFDYRQLNAITRTATRPTTPIINALSKFLDKNCVISTLYLKLNNGTWQLNIREEDRDKTAFKAPQGTFRFRKMPNILRNTAVTIEKFVKYFRSDPSIDNITVIPYLDEIMVISDSYEHHMKDLEVVLKRFRQLKFQIDRSRCIFARESVTYLGYTISHEGVSRSPTMVEIMLNKEPTSYKHWDRLFQICSWYHPLIPGLQEKLQPFVSNAYTEPFLWGTTQMQAYQTVKRFLTFNPQLNEVDYNLPFIIRISNRNSYVISVVLLQEKAGTELPIEFSSRLLTPAERAHTAEEREMVGLIYAIKKFRFTIYNRPMIVRSEFKKPLSFSDEDVLWLRWNMVLQKYDIRYDYNRPVPDLARIDPLIPRNGLFMCTICTTVRNMLTCEPVHLRENQLQDPCLKSIIKEMEENNLQTFNRSNNMYVMREGVLYQIQPNVMFLFLVLPEDIMKPVRDTYRNAHKFCHPDDQITGASSASGSWGEDSDPSASSSHTFGCSPFPRVVEYENIKLKSRNNPEEAKSKSVLPQQGNPLPKSILCVTQNPAMPESKCQPKKEVTLILLLHQTTPENDIVSLRRKHNVPKKELCRQVANTSESKLYTHHIFTQRPEILKQFVPVLKFSKMPNVSKPKSETPEQHSEVKPEDQNLSTPESKLSDRSTIKLEVSQLHLVQEPKSEKPVPQNVATSEDQNISVLESKFCEQANVVKTEPELSEIHNEPKIKSEMSEQRIIVNP